MRYPSRPVAALGSDRGEHAVPFAADLRIIGNGSGPARGIDEAEIAVDHFNGAWRWRRQIAAAETGHPADASGATLPAFDDLWPARLVAIAGGMGRVLRLAVGVEGPRDVVLGEAEPVGGTGMIDDDAVRLVRCRPEPASPTRRMPSPAGSKPRLT